MADEADYTDMQSEFLMSARIRDIRNQGRELNPKGACHWCDEPFEHVSQKLFCDSDCSFDYERSKR